MKLLILTDKNFKGINSFNIVAGGKNVLIFGDNATGKTTIYDSFLWLLFDKDSQNKKDFEIKTLNANGEVIHGLDHEVEGSFDVGGKEITLKKSFKEKWTQKRGTANKIFTGHTTDYYVDGVPVKLSEYKAIIDKIAEENLFKLLTSPTFFNEQLKWQDRRNMIMQVCGGDISDRDVIDSMATLSNKDGILTLTNIINQRKLDDHKKIIASRRAEINKELEKLPVRIDEVTKGLPDVEGISTVAIQSKIDTIKKRIRDNEQQISRIQNGGEISEKTKALREVEGQLLDMQNTHRAKYEAQVREKQAEYERARDSVQDLQRKVKTLERGLASCADEDKELQAKIEVLRNDWHIIYSWECDFEQGDTCPTCGQALPAEQLEKARATAEADFKRKKAEELEAINTKGKALKASVGKLAAEKAEHKKILTDTSEKLTAALETEMMLKNDIDNLRLVMDAYSESPAYIKLVEQKKEISYAITDLRDGRQTESTKIQAEISMLEQEIKTAQARLNDFDLVTRGQARIKELTAQEKALAKEYEKLEGELYLCEQFTRTKVNLLNEKINSRFKMARFKMFDEQINGGLQECCETVFDGVPYSSLNNAARINVGLDIINTLSEHYDFTAPIFIDNREAVCRLIETRAQVISLIVSEGDKKLRIEHEMEVA